MRFSVTAPLLLLPVLAGLASGAETRECLFRGMVVPLEAPDDARTLPGGPNDFFAVRLRVIEVVAGDGVIEAGHDYVFHVHSIVQTFGADSVDAVAGRTFIWLASTSSTDGRGAVAIHRGESLYEDYKKQKEGGMNRRIAPLNAAGSRRDRAAPGRAQL